LYFAIGDFTVQTGEVAGYAQIDERSKKNDSQSTSANTNNLQGKINRIHLESVGTYTIPEGNLFLVCLNCHQINSKLVGPSFEDIARRYGGEDSVMTYLPKKNYRWRDWKLARKYCHACQSIAKRNRSGGNHTVHFRS